MRPVCCQMMVMDWGQFLDAAVVQGERDDGRNRVAVVVVFMRLPRVARASQPWALGRNPLGILLRPKGYVRPAKIGRSLTLPRG